MPCACGKRKNGTTDAAIEREANQLLLPTQWGPIMWKLLHIIAEKIGQSGNMITDMDQANYVKALITSLPSILPCQECQSHAETYLATNPFPVLTNMNGLAMSNIVRIWLFTFHNHVRTMNEQEPLATPEECHTLYAYQILSHADYTTLMECMIAATRQQWVRLDQWKKWYSVMERLRLLTGTIVL